MTGYVKLTGRLLLAVTIAGGLRYPVSTQVRPAGYAPDVKPLDTLRVKLAGQPARARRAAGVLGAVVPGYLSSRGLPPVHGRFTVTDTGLVFRASDGSATRFPLVGPLRETAGRKWRASTVALAYIDKTGARPVYLFRIDAGVFGTAVPGPLLDVASHPRWLDSLAASEWVVDQRLVGAGDSTALWATARDIAASVYADSLYTLFGSPKSPIGLMGKRGRRAGRLGEYNSARDSLALDPGAMTGKSQLRHTLAHELGHRWQSRAPGQVTALWRGVIPIRDPRRYGYGSVSEHQAEAIAFAVNFLQTTTSTSEPAATSLSLLDHYEVLVPGTRIMVRYLALQPIYRGHPLRGWLTTGRI